MTKVSVIVPVYNTENFLERCLNSLVNQTLNDMEIIVVNDGSTDASQEIIDRFANDFPNIIRAYRKKNGGLSSARNYGLDMATGEYIGFIDSDDYVELDMFEKMYNKACSRNFDVVVCDVRYVYKEKNFIASSRINNDLISKDQVKNHMVDIYPAAWNKIYKCNLFNVRFKKGIWYEDVEFLYRLFPYVNSIGVVKEPLINYVQRDGAITHTFDERVYDYISNWNGIVQFYKSNNIFDEYYSEIEYSYVRYLYMTFVKTATNFSKKEFNKACLKAKQNVLNTFPNYKKNKYLKNAVGFYLKHFNLLTTSLVYYFYRLKR